MRPLNTPGRDVESQMLDLHADCCQVAKRFLTKLFKLGR